ncbi:UNVERIFIED_ORG: hypothetical protein ABIB52_000796 [Arthrobacter sp. UYCu721]
MTHTPVPPVPIEFTAVAAEGPALTWESLHGVIAAALRHVDLTAPLYVAADVLTDELLPSLKGVSRPTA